MMTIIEILLFAIIVIVMWRTRRDQKDFIMVFMLGAFVLVTMLNRGYLSKLLNNRLSAALGWLSYPMYLNQGIFQNIAKKVFPGLPFWPVVAASLAALILYSLVVTLFLDWTIKRISCRKKSGVPERSQ